MTRARSAGTRIAGTTAAIFLGVASITGLAAITFTQLRMKSALDHAIEEGAAPLVRIGRTQGHEALVAAIERIRPTNAGQIGFALFTRDGRRVAGALDVDRPDAGWHDGWTHDPVEGDDPARLLAVDLPGGDRLVAAGNRRPLQMAQHAIMWLYLGSVAMVALLCGVMAVLLARHIDRSLRPISATVDEVRDGRLSARVPQGATDEFGATAASVNTMLDRIGVLVTNLRQVSTDVAHDLRTPLTRARVALEAALTSGEPARTDAIARALEHVDDTLALFSAILRVAEVEEHGAHGTLEPLALDVLVNDVVTTFTPVFSDGGMVLRATVVPQAQVLGDRAQLAMLLVNLLENVLRHAGRGVVTVVRVTDDGRTVRLSVSDTGPGVPDEALARIFDRFVQLDPSRAQGGHGLGLSLARAIAHAHNGSIEAKPNQPGLEITVSLPSWHG